VNAIALKCPRCGEAALVATERQDIEIDVCPSCRGVWLDRGELDKLIERSLALRPAPAGARAQDDDDDDDDDDRRWRRDERHDRDDRHPDHRRRRHSWLSELFD